MIPAYTNQTGHKAPLLHIHYLDNLRLQNKPFHEALFAFDALGNRFHFRNTGLVERVMEKEVELLKMNAISFLI